MPGAAHLDAIKLVILQGSADEDRRLRGHMRAHMLAWSARQGAAAEAWTKVLLLAYAERRGGALERHVD